MMRSRRCDDDDDEGDEANLDDEEGDDEEIEYDYEEENDCDKERTSVNRNMRATIKNKMVTREEMTTRVTTTNYSKEDRIL
jgi:hypothetical protein